MDTITKSLAKELGPRKIRVNSINPGLVITEGTHTAGIVGSDFETNAVASTPLGRVGQPGRYSPFLLSSSRPKTRAGSPVRQSMSQAALQSDAGAYQDDQAILLACSAYCVRFKGQSCDRHFARLPLVFLNLWLRPLSLRSSSNALFKPWPTRTGMRCLHAFTPAAKLSPVAAPREICQSRTEQARTIFTNSRPPT